DVVTGDVAAAEIEVAAGQGLREGAHVCVVVVEVGVGDAGIAQRTCDVTRLDTAGATTVVTGAAVGTVCSVEVIAVEYERRAADAEDVRELGVAGERAKLVTVGVKQGKLCVILAADADQRWEKQITVG